MIIMNIVIFLNGISQNNEQYISNALRTGEKMEIRTLRYFLAVAREENMTRAAELLHVTQNRSQTSFESSGTDK